VAVVEIRVGEWLARAFEIYRSNLVLLIATHFVGVMLGVITLGVLMAPMLAGMFAICLRLVDGDDPKPQVGDLFLGFKHFVQPLLFLLVWVVLLSGAQALLMSLPVVGQVASLMLSFLSGALLLFGIPLIVDRGMEFWPASMTSIETVRAALWPFVALSAVASLLASIGALLFGFGIFLTLPIYTCVTAVAYRQCFERVDGPFESAVRPPPIEV
jgi:uncharacterized membrane protein